MLNILDGVHNIFQNEDFFFVIAFRAHVNVVFRAPITQVKTRPRREVLKTPASRLGVDGRKRRFSKLHYASSVV